MRKIIVICAVLVIVVVMVILCACSQKKEDAAISDQCLRIHIRANSNSDADQSVKLKVRDNLTVFFTELLENCKTKDDAYSTLNQAMPEIQRIADSTLSENGFSYNAKVTLSREHFPDRDYDGLTFPEGDYDALVVGLGEATGNNWWCVAFPPLCFVPNGDGEKIIYKSWVKEMIDKIFNNAN